MRATVLNREFQHPSDGWYQIEAPGDHPNAQAGVVQVIDSQAVASIVNRFNSEADGYQDRTGQPFPGMLVDHDHFKHDADKESVAYGWLMRMENRNGVPFGRIKWTATGEPAVDGGDYRFFSTEYDPKDLQNLTPGKSPARVRPLRLDGLTLTNEPNNKGGSPITNRQQAVADSTSVEIVPRPFIPAHRMLGPSGFRVFKEIVGLVRNRTGWKFEQAFNSVLRDNRDLLSGSFAPTDSAPVLLRLLNRAGDPTIENFNRVTAEVGRISQEIFPNLNREPLALQWDALMRAATHLEKAGFAEKLLNRSSSREMEKDGLTARQAFQKLKETQPVLWAHSILMFDPERYK